MSLSPCGGQDLLSYSIWQDTVMMEMNKIMCCKNSCNEVF